MYIYKTFHGTEKRGKQQLRVSTHRIRQSDLSMCTIRINYFMVASLPKYASLRWWKLTLDSAPRPSSLQLTLSGSHQIPLPSY